jgi:hypothetical protein
LHRLWLDGGLSPFMLHIVFVAVGNATGFSCHKARTDTVKSVFQSKGHDLFPSALKFQQKQYFQGYSGSRAKARF